MTPSVPDELDQVLSPGWLSAALGTRYPGLRVTGVTRGPVISRVSTNARFTIECEGGLPDGLPANLCAKGYFGEGARRARRAGEREARFYRDLVGRTGVRTLRAVYADVDPDTGANVLITEDAVATGGTFLDASHDYTPDQVAESLTQLATLHAATWGVAAVAEDWLAPRLELHLAARGLAEISGNFDSWIGAGVPDEVRHPDRLVDSYRALATAVKDPPVWSLLHGDTHVGNLYLDAGGRPSLVDWQLVQRGPWYLDVGYHLASTLTVDDRRRVERDLLRHYLDRLRAGGVDAPAWDDAWQGIRSGILHGFFLWGITLLVDPAITRILLERLGTAAADHDALA